MKNLFIDFEKFTPEERILATQLKNFLTDFNYRIEEEANGCYLYDLLFVVNGMLNDLLELDCPNAERDVDIIKLRYFTDEKMIPFEKIGEIYNISKQRVMQIVYKLLGTMRKRERREPLDNLVFKRRFIKNQIKVLENEIKELEMEISRLKRRLDDEEWTQYRNSIEISIFSVLDVSSKTEKALKRAGRWDLGDVVRAMKSKEQIRGLDSNSRAEVIEKLEEKLGVKIE